MSYKYALAYGLLDELISNLDSIVSIKTLKAHSCAYQVFGKLEDALLYAQKMEWTKIVHCNLTRFSFELVDKCIIIPYSEVDEFEDQKDDILRLLKDIWVGPQYHGGDCMTINIRGNTTIYSATPNGSAHQFMFCSWEERRQFLVAKLEGKKSDV